MSIKLHGNLINAGYPLLPSEGITVLPMNNRPGINCTASYSLKRI